MGFKKYLVGGNGLPTDFSIGGLPLFSDDIKQLETNAQIFGLYSMLRGWAVILSGCHVSNVDTDSSTCDISEGLVLLDDVVYQFNGLIGQTYPFSIKKGAEIIDTRVFRDGNSKDVGIEYEYTIRTSFLYPNGSPNSDQPYPNDIIGGEEIFFDPFTAQRSEYVLKNLGHVIGEFKMGNWTTNNVLKTTDDFGNNIIGSQELRNFTLSGLGRWSNLGWVQNNTTSQNIRLSSLSQGAQIGGKANNEVTLGRNNLPPHKHNRGDYVTTEDGAHVHNFTVSGDLNLDSGSIYPLLRQNPDIDIADTPAGMTTEGLHTHTLQGHSGDGSHIGNFGGCVGESFDITNAYRNVASFYYEGYFVTNFQNGYYYPLFKEGTYYTSQQLL